MRRVSEMAHSRLNYQKSFAGVHDGQPDVHSPNQGPIVVHSHAYRVDFVGSNPNAMAKPDNAGAGSYDYMHLFGLVALGYMWCRIAEAVLAKLPKADGSAARLDAKLVTARFFMERMLPETATRLARIEAGAGSTMELTDDAF